MIGLAILGLTACPETVSLPPVPPEVAYVAVVERSEGRVVDASVLRSTEDSVTFFGLLDRDLAVIGYGAEPISSWLEQWFAGSLPSGELVPVAGCMAELPPPIWMATNDGGPTFAQTDAAAAPRLTAPWLTDRCPAFVPDQVTVNVACDSNPCLQSRRQLGPCRFEFDLSRCGQPPADVTVRPDGTACLADRDERRCAQSSPVLDAAASLVCQGVTDIGDRFEACPTEVYLTPSPRLRIVAERGLVELSPNLPSWIDGIPVLTTRDLRRGPLLDLVVSDDRVAVLGLPPQVDRSDASCENEERPRRLYLLEPLGLTVTSTVVVPSCAEHLVAAPTGAGFMFAHLERDADTWSVVRTDRTGGVIADVPVPLPANTRIQDLASTTDGSGRLLALAVAGRVGGSTQATLLHIDGESLQVVDTVVVDGRYTNLAAYPSGDLLLSSQRQDNIELLRGPFANPSQDREPFSPPEVLRADLRAIAMSPSGLGRDAVVAISGNQPLIIAWGPTTTAVAGPLDRNFQPSAVTAWPAQPGRVLIGGVTTDRPTRAIIHVFDGPSARLLPGPVLTGTSAATAFGIRRDGDIYALLGWSGRVLRLVANDP